MQPASSIPPKPPFRAENVGSLLRPLALYAKRKEMDEMKHVPDDLKAVEDDAIKHAVKLQKDVGIKTITDGELRRFHISLMPLDSSHPSETFTLGVSFSMAFSINLKVW